MVDLESDKLLAVGYTDFGLDFKWIAMEKVEEEEIAMKDPNILSLPPKILLKILEFVDNRWNASQVCRSFYDYVVYIDHMRYRFGLTNSDEVGNSRESKN